MRLAALLLLSLVFSLPLAWACDLQTSTRQVRAPGYVTGVQTCLVSPPSGFQFDEALERDNISRVNAERTRRGLKPLLIRSDLQDAARWHSMDMAANNYFSHREKSTRTHADRIALLDRTLIHNLSRENIAQVRGGGLDGVERGMLHQGLMDSDSHREAILSSDVTHMAVGAVRFKDGVWLTQLFVNKMGEFSAPVPVRVHPRQELELDLYIRDWFHKGFEARQNDASSLLQSRTDRKIVRLPDRMLGDFQLMVRGERSDGQVVVKGNRREQRFERIALSGPMMSAVRGHAAVPDEHTPESKFGVTNAPG